MSSEPGRENEIWCQGVTGEVGGLEGENPVRGGVAGRGTLENVPML